MSEHDDETTAENATPPVTETPDDTAADTTDSAAATDGGTSGDGEDTPDAAAAPHVPWYRRIRWWGWTLIGILVAVLAVVGTFGVQGLMIKHHEQKALHALTSVVKKGDLSKLPEAITKMQAETAAANDLAHTGLWGAAAGLPGLGVNVQSLQGMTQVVDDAAHETLPKYLDIVADMPVKSLFSDGTVHIQPILDAKDRIVEANDSLRKQVEAYDNIPQPTIGLLAGVYDRGRTLLDTGMQAADWAVTDVIPHLRDWFGYDATQTYAILVMTPAEARVSGGLIGAVGTLTIKDGKFEVGNFEPNTTYYKDGHAFMTEDEQRIYQAQGPIHMYYDIRDFANYPDTQRIAEEFLALWDRKHEDDPQLLTGVVTCDPVFVQVLVKVLGDVTLPDGRVLTGTNTADFLMNTVYKDYAPEETDAYFGTVATACIKRLMDDPSLAKLAAIAKQVPTLAQNRHLNVWFFNPYLMPIGLRLGLVASIPTSETAPAVGIYMTEQNPSKMSWYIRRSTTVDEIDCGSDNADPQGTKYHVTYTLTNTMDPAEVDSLPWYITGVDAIGRGNGYEKLAFYPPEGGTISNFQVTGNGAEPTADVINLRYMFHTLTQVQPGRTVTYSFDVQVSPDATERLRVDQTPSQEETPDVTYTKSCPVEW